MGKKAFLDKIADSNGDEKYIAILKYAWFLRQKEPMESAKQAKIVLKFARKEKKNDFEFSALKYLSYAYFYYSDMKEAGRWADEIRKTGQKHDNSRAIGVCYSMKSRIALQQNNTSEAMENILIALEYYLKENNIQDLISCYTAMGMIHLQREENTEAEQYLQLALQKAEEIDSHAQHSIRVNIGNVLYKQQKFEESLKMYLKSLEYFQEHNMENSVATALLNIGLCHKSLGDNEVALENLKQSYDLCKKLKNPQKLGLAANAIANDYILKRDWENTLKYLKEALKVAEDNDYKVDKVSCYSTYIKYNEMKEDFVEASKYLHKLVKIKDEINSDNNQKEIADLETKYKTQIYRLETAELDVKNRTISNQNIELNKTLENLRNTYQNLKEKFQETVIQLNTQDERLSSQSRMAMMGEMISSIAHQWKQPLNVVWIMAQAIGDAWEFDELNDEFMQEQLDRIGEQVMYMSDTINDFRNFFKPEYVCDFNVAETIEKSIKLVSYMMNKKNIKITKELATTCYINGNPSELVQVLINLMNNAKDAILRTNLTESFINISLTCNAETITIKVFNKGDLINPEYLKKIFDPYFTTRGEKGTGIGLSICQNIIENKFNGKISVQNLTDGVEFDITLLKE